MFDDNKKSHLFACIMWRLFLHIISHIVINTLVFFSFFLIIKVKTNHSYFYSKYFKGYSVSICKIFSGISRNKKTVWVGYSFCCLKKQQLKNMISFHNILGGILSAHSFEVVNKLGILQKFKWIFCKQDYFEENHSG